MDNDKFIKAIKEYKKHVPNESVVLIHNPLDSDTFGLIDEDLATVYKSLEVEPTFFYLTTKEEIAKSWHQ